MTTFRVRLADDETALLERLVDAHPTPLLRADCDQIALGNLVAIGCANAGASGFRHAFVTAAGVALWETRTPRSPTEGEPSP